MATTSMERAGAVRGRLAVPWSTVMPLAVLMAYADGFWMVSVRGAVGAIERTQSPFTSWWRESTVALPVFVFAVLGAVTWALRRFGPALRTPRTMLATGLLVAAAGTVVAIAELLASSAYDYYLQSEQLQMMDSMRSSCIGSCLEQGQQSTLAALGRAVLYVSGLLLLTNLVLVGWLVAMRGGRLDVAAVRPRIGGAVGVHLARAGRIGYQRQLLAIGLLGGAAIHAAVVPDHLTEWPAAGAFFILLTAAQVALAGVLVVRQHSILLVTAVILNVVPLLLWLYSRTLGLPFGPAPGVPEAVGVADVAACVLEVAALTAAVLLLRAAPSPGQQPPVSPHVRGLVAVALIAVTVIGLAGTAPRWFDQPASSGDQSVMVLSG